MADIGMPKLSIIFKGLGASAVARSQGGRMAVLIVRDDTDTDRVAEYRFIDDFTSEEAARYTETNAKYIKDVLEGVPKTLVVFRLQGEEALSDIFKDIKGKVDMNCWIAMADATQTETDDLVTFVKSSVANDKKRYKALVYQANKPDDMHVVNLVNDNAGEYIPYLLGQLAGSNLDMSMIAKPLKIDIVEEPDDLDAAINDGGFVLYNDEGEVRVARSVNSLVSTGQGITDDMKFILVVEVMDMIYTDIFKTWRDFYKGRYKNSLDNQMLLIGAINAYFTALANDMFLDPNFDNRVEIDIEKQRLANIPKYGEEEVATWDDEKVMEMTVGTNVYLKARIKILNAMEDIEFIIEM